MMNLEKISTEELNKMYSVMYHRVKETSKRVENVTNDLKHFTNELNQFTEARDSIKAELERRKKDV